MTPEGAAEVAVTTSKAVVIADHLKNNRIEYLIVLGIGTMMGWTSEVMQYASGVCA
jgi:hypothetical protein